MASINQVILIGNVGKEPEIRTMQNGGKVATFSVATTEPAYTTKDGRSIAERTDWHSVVVWRGLADVVEKYIHKGSSVFVQGKLHNRSYDDQNGQKKYVTEIETEKLQLLDKKPNADAPQQQQQPYGSGVQKLVNHFGGEQQQAGVPEQLPF